ncbi:MAG: response regulator transcription factor [Oscillospiraceae bacterium]|nr:response regulator transcription factor [Oscillospiraceae bacterium]
MSAEKILVADDNAEIREFIRVMLESEGFDVLEAVDGGEVVEKADDSVDLIILDVMMPVKDGYRACMELREKTKAPILFLTAKTQDSDKALGFSLGGDDYLSKPFSYTELISRVKALLRRYCVYKGKDGESGDGFLKVGDVKISGTANQVFVGENEVFLTEIEYRILLLMLKNRGKVFSAENLYESIWNEPYLYSSGNTVMVHIKNIRKKLGDDTQSPHIIKTVWGRGYRIE